MNEELVLEELRELRETKELFKKYISHIVFYEGRDYLGESYTHGSPTLTDNDAVLIGYMMNEKE
jgi:hypothetical protein